MKNQFKKYSTVFSAIVAIYLLLGCGWYVNYDEVRYLVMNPNIMDNKAWWNYYYYTNHIYYGEVQKGEGDEKKIAADWKKQLKLNSSVEEIYKFIFHYDPENKAAYTNVEKELEANKTWRLFMSYARECESVIYNPDPWGTIDNDSLANERMRLANDGLVRLTKQKDPFWKKKYAFQLLRLAYYQFDKVIFYQVYDTYFGFRKEKQPIDWWATHYLSMMYEQEGKVDSANFLHAQVFSHSDNKMHVSHLMYTDSNFAKQLELCVTDEEKANVYLLAGMKKYFNAVDHIHEVYSLYPKHSLLPLLLTREVNKVEDIYGTEPINSNYYDWGWYDNYEHKPEYSNATRTIVHLGSLYNEVRHMDFLKTSNPDFYHLILADLAILSRDVQVAQQSLDRISSKDTMIVFQKSVMKTMLIAISSDIRKEETQDLIGKELNYLLQTRFGQFWSQPILRSLFNYLGVAFMQKGMMDKSVLCAYIANAKLYGGAWNAVSTYLVINDLDEVNTNGTIENIIALFDKPDKNALEKILLRPYPDARYHWEILGTVYLRQNNLQKSLNAFNQIPPDSWAFSFNTEELDQNPLIVSHLHKYKAEFVYWSKTQIVDTLYKIDSKPNKSFRDYQLLGNAWFNFSKFGNSWYMLDYFYNSDFLFQNEYWNINSLTARINKIALNNSISYYKKALPLARDQEDIAETVYMLAWCYYMLNDAGSYMNWAGKYEQMQNTELYRIESCTMTPLYDEPDTLKDRWGRIW